MSDFISLNISFNEVEAAPELITPPDGIYTVAFCGTRFEATDYEDKENCNVLTHYYQILGIEKVNDLDDEDIFAPPIGSLLSERFRLTKQGMPYWGTRAVSMFAALGEELPPGDTPVQDIIKYLIQEFSNEKTCLKLQKTTNKGGYANYKIIGASSWPATAPAKLWHPKEA
jgi:hypothetical protein